MEIVVQAFSLRGRSLFRDRLEALFLEDTKSRWRIIGWCSIITAATGLLLEQGLGIDSPAALGCATVLGVAAFSVSVLGYAWSVKTWSVKIEAISLPVERRMVLRWVIAIPGSVTIAILADKAAPPLMASIVEDRVRKIILYRDPLDTRELENSHEVLDYARAARILVQPSLLFRAQESLLFRLKDLPPVDRNEYWQLLSSLLSYTSFVKGKARDPAELLKSIGFPVIDFNQHGQWTSTQGHGVAFVGILVVLDASLNERGAIYGPNALRRIFENAIFLRCHINYGGGDIRLHNVKFIDCTFNIAPGSNSGEFAGAVAHGDVRNLVIGDPHDIPARTSFQESLPKPAR
jgi:hypothetical protein